MKLMQAEAEPETEIEAGLRLGRSLNLRTSGARGLQMDDARA